MEIAEWGVRTFTGGVMGSLQGGEFGHAFVSAGLSAAFMPHLGDIGNPVGRTVSGAIVGGTISRATGGKFANGAVTGAIMAAMSGKPRLASRAKWAGISRGFEDAPDDLKPMLLGTNARKEALQQISEREGYGVVRSRRIEYVNSPKEVRLSSGRRYYDTDVLAEVVPTLFGKPRIIFYSSAFEPGEYHALVSLIDHEQFHYSVLIGEHTAISIYDNEVSAIQYQRTRPAWSRTSQGFKDAMQNYEAEMRFCAAGGAGERC